MAPIQALDTLSISSTYIVKKYVFYRPKRFSYVCYLLKPRQIDTFNESLFNEMTFRQRNMPQSDSISVVRPQYHVQAKFSSGR